jgi:dTDP-glucose pyrophosphorylase
MAGQGSRFTAEGYTKPKFLVDVLSQPMIEAVIKNLNLEDANYIFLVLKEHLDSFDLLNELNKIAPDCKVVSVDSITDGAARTTLIAKDLINNDSPLIIANSDQIINWDRKVFSHLVTRKNVVALFKSTDPKWSYAKIVKNKIVQVAEKKVISDDATVGVYGWRKGSDYVKYAEQMISKNIRTNNEFYVCPVYNEAIEDKQEVVPFYVAEMHGIGTPEDLKTYLALEEVKNA